MKVEDIRGMAHDIIERNAVENDYIEYKKSASSKDKILKTACAYANNYMNREIGLIFIGIQEEDDEETGRKAVPIRPISEIDEAKIETIENELKSLLSNIHPRIHYHLLQDTIDSKNYIVIAVEPGHDGPYETDQRAEKDKSINLKPGRYIRVRRDSRIPNKREEFELLKKFAEYHFSSELNETATLNDLNYEYMKEYLVQTKAHSDILSMSKLDMAKAMNLIDASEYGGYRAKNFAVLMFADEPDKFIPYAFVEVIRELDGTDKMESKSFKGPIWIQAKRVREYFRDTIMASCTIREPGVSGAHRVFNWPLEMFEELSTNCILHKEYSHPQYIGIYVYKDHLSFVNHNRPLPPITIEDLNEKVDFDDRQYLNYELKEMFFKLDLIQSYGSGIRRAKKAMEFNGSPKLVFNPSNDTDNYTQAIAYINEEYALIQEQEHITKSLINNIINETVNGNEPVNVFENELVNGIEPVNTPENETVDGNKIENETQPSLKPNTINMPKEITEYLNDQNNRRSLTAESILKVIMTDSHITIPEISRIAGISKSTVKQYLKEFQQAGILRREGSDKKGQWIVLR